ncbi:MAG: heme o synthase [Longimicrobiales bacterium]|nr:heme o synthase [Longimicrobiales bacterium]
MGPTQETPLDMGSAGSDAGTAPRSPADTAGVVHRIAAYVELTKPGIAVYVMVAAGVSYFVGAAGSPELALLLHVVLGTGAATAGSLALNQVIERRLDALMERTRGRPLPSGRVETLPAFAFGTVLLLLGVAYLWWATGWLPASLALLSALIYTLGYTPLKIRSYLATLVGAIPGAMPVLIGWTASTGALSLGGLSLFAVVFLWQLPHVLAIGWLLRRDYARAGFLLVPPSDPGGHMIGWHMVLYATALVPVSLFPSLLGVTGEVYWLGALILSLAYLAPCIAATRGELTARKARWVFFTSLAYLPLLFLLMVLDTPTA